MKATKDEYDLWRIWSWLIAGSMVFLVFFVLTVVGCIQANQYWKTRAIEAISKDETKDIKIRDRGESWSYEISDKPSQ